MAMKMLAATALAALTIPTLALVGLFLAAI
jgi:hypothetical protein